MIVIVEKEVRKVSSAVITGLIRSGISPFARDGLDEAFGLAVGLRTIGPREEMFEAELLTGGGEVAGAIGRAAVGQDALAGDAMSFVKSDGLVESGEDAVDLFIWQEAGEGETGVIIDGDVETLDAGAWVADGAIAGSADAGAGKAAQLLDVEVKEFARVSTLITLWRRFGAIESGEAVEAVSAQDTRDGGLRDLKNGEDLSVGTALTTQSQDVGDEFGTGAARLMVWSRGAIVELGRKGAVASALDPPADGAFADVVGGSDLAPRETGGVKMGDHFGSHFGGKSGISVHVVRAGWLGVEF